MVLDLGIGAVIYSEDMCYVNHCSVVILRTVEPLRALLYEQRNTEICHNILK